MISSSAAPPPVDRIKILARRIKIAANSRNVTLSLIVFLLT